MSLYSSRIKLCRFMSLYIVCRRLPSFIFIVFTRSDVWAWVWNNEERMNSDHKLKDFCFLFLPMRLPCDRRFAFSVLGAQCANQLNKYLLVKCRRDIVVVSRRGGKVFTETVKQVIRDRRPIKKSPFIKRTFKQTFSKAPLTNRPVRTKMFSSREWIVHD